MIFFLSLQERRKDLTDYRDESTFSFDPSRIPVKQLQDRENRSTKMKLDGRKGVLLSSVTRKRKKSRRRRPLSQQRQQSEQQYGQDEDTVEGATVETDMTAMDASASHLIGGATTSADDGDGDDSGSRSSTPCRKRKTSLPPPEPPVAPSPQPATPPPQPEPPPNTVGVVTVAKSTVTAADTLRPCALVAPQGEWTSYYVDDSCHFRSEAPKL